MTDVATVARGLSEAQRYRVKRGCISGDFTMATVRALTRKEFFSFVANSPNGLCGFMEPTPLGLAVRAHLLSGEAS